MNNSQAERLFQSYHTLIKQYDELIKQVYGDIENFCDENTYMAGPVKVVSASKLKLKINTSRTEVLRLLKEVNSIH
jgi:hypothetical protein